MKIERDRFRCALRDVSNSAENRNVFKNQLIYSEKYGALHLIWRFGRSFARFNITIALFFKFEIDCLQKFDIGKTKNIRAKSQNKSAAKEHTQRHKRPEKQRYARSKSDDDAVTAVSDCNSLILSIVV